MAQPATVGETVPREVPRAERPAAVVLLVVLAALAPLSVDMFLPSMPEMADQFGTSEATMQLAVTLFIVSFAGSQLVYGPMSDRYGRRPLLTFGLLLFTVGGVAALTAQSAEWLIAARVVQGLGGGAAPALSQAIVLDVFGRERAARVIGYFAIVLPLAPAAAPVIGSGLHAATGWEGVFWTLALLGAALLIGYRLLIPETNPAGSATRPVTTLGARYREVLRSPRFGVYAVLLGLMFGGQLVFISSSSFVLIDTLGVSNAGFALSFAFVALGIMGGATVASRLGGRMEAATLVLVGAVLSSAAAAAMGALVLAGVETPAGVVLPMFVSALGLGMTRAPATAAAVVPFAHVAGLASSLLVFGQMLLASGYNVVYAAAVEPSAGALAVGVLLPVAAAVPLAWALRARGGGATRAAAAAPPA